MQDSGVGFDPAAQTQLFEKFTRLRSAGPPSPDVHPGSGLGLYIVQRLMQLSHGRVRAHSEGAGRGASFHLTWPAAQEPPA